MQAYQHTDISFAKHLDQTDTLVRYRKRFFIPEGTIYMDGNSLGLLSADAEASLQRVLTEWRILGIRGWLEAERPWFWFAEEVGNMAAPLVGAEYNELVLTGGTTVNIHALVSTFYRPSGKRTKILADALNFPSDLYALQSQIRLKGLDPQKELVLVPGIDGHTLDEGRIVSMMTDETELVFLPSVLYTSGQLLNIKYLTEEAHKRGIIIGFDCSHSVGAVPHHLSKWEVDFATFCGYKYLNGGPGCPAFIYVNKKHFQREPLMAGWFGFKKEKQFDMSPNFEHEQSAGGWQISSPGILGSATMEGSLRMIEKAGIENIRRKSLALTNYLIALAKELLLDPPYNFSLATPEEEKRRGGHVAFYHPTEAWRISEALKAHNIVTDFRSPDIIRIAPVALYNTFEEVWKVIHTMKDIFDNEEFKKFDTARKPVS
jgi:kynureninase